MTLAERLVLAAAGSLLWLRYPLFCADYSWRKKRLAQFAAPRNLSDLVQWRKLFDHNPLFVTLTDKLAAKAWIADRLPELRCPEVVWTGQRAEDIPAELITPDYVIKTNHASHQNCFPGRERLERIELDRRLNSWLARPYKVERQWAYLGIRPRLLVERMIHSARPLMDISFRVHGGRPSVGHVATDFKTEAARDGYFYPDGRRIELPPSAHDLAPDFRLPPAFAQARELSARLGQDADYFRVDFLCTENEVYFGEITIYPASGMGSDTHPADLIYESWLASIEKSWFLATPQPWPLSLYAGAFRRWARQRNMEIAAARLTDPAVAPAPPDPVP